jgi:Zn-finger nucleic acid-binding protein
VDPFRTPGTPGRSCPRCELGLGTRHVLDVALDECTGCTGVFVPIDVVPRVLDPLDLGLEVVRTFAPGEPELETNVRYLRCPRCQAMMNRRLLVRGSSVVVDICRDHGVWFDAHELRRAAELASDHEVIPLDRGAEPERWTVHEQRRQRDAALVRAASQDERGTLLASLITALTYRFRR